jgi:hypothetical protein
MGMNRNKSMVSDLAWGEVDKSALGRSLQAAYKAKEITAEDIRDVYAYVPDAAFTEDSDGNPKFTYSKAWGPHHAVDGEAILVSRSGISGVAGALNGARSEPALDKKARKEAKKHIRQHYADLEMPIPESLNEHREIGPGRPIQDGAPLEEVKGSMEQAMRMIRDAFDKLYGYRGDVNTPWYYIVETFADYLIVRIWMNDNLELGPDEFYLVRYSQETGGSFVFAAREQWEIVELTYQPKTQMFASESAKQPASKSGRKLTERVERAVKLLEAKAGSPRTIKAIGITADVVNANGRRYSANVLSAAVNEAKTHLHESAGQGRLVERPQNLLGEAEHPSDKPSGRPNLLETIVRWTDIQFDGVHVLLDGAVVETSKGRDFLAVLESGVIPGISQRGYGESVMTTENGQKIEDVTSLTITGYDVVSEPSDPEAGITVLESQSNHKSVEDDMNLEELKKLIAEHPEVFKGVLAESLKEMGEAQLKSLEEQARAALGIGPTDDLAKALAEASQAKKTLDEQKQRQGIEAAIGEHTKALPYGKELNLKFVEAVRATNPATPEAVKALVEAKRKEYDAIVAQARIGAMGGSGIQMLGSVLENETGTPEFARGAHEFGESLVRAGLQPRRDFRKPRTLNEQFAAIVLERFDKLYQNKLMAEARLMDEAMATSDLNLPYSVSRAVIAAAFPQLIATGVFDFGVTDQTPSRIYYETYVADSGLTVTVTDESVVTVADTWVAMAQKRINPGTVVVTSSPAGTTYTEGTDFVVDYGNGKLMALSTGTIGSGATVLVDYVYLAVRKGENAAIERGKMQLAYKTLEIAADRLATQITSEAVVFSRSQIGWDATTRTLNSLVNEIRRKIDGDICYLALSAALSVASNSGGTWDASADPLSDFVEYLGVSRVKIAKRYYQPTSILMSTTNADLVANWDGFTAAGSRPDADLNAEGYVGRLKGLPVFHTTEFSDGYSLVVNRELVAHRVFQPMTLKGPLPSYSGGQLIAADQWYAEEYNGTDAPLANKGSYVKIV